MTPIILPPEGHPVWANAKAIALALHTRGKSNPFIVASLVHSYAESAWTAVIKGDRDKSFGPWQMNWKFYGAPILAHLGIDIRTETDFAQHVEAMLWALSAPGNEKTLEALNTAKTGADATRAFFGFERAGAADAQQRRIDTAPAIEIALVRMLQPDP